MQQILSNLLSNAVKFSAKGAQVALSASQSDEFVRFEIRDQGEGIPENFRDKIFGKFSQADSSSSRQKGGTGLGLSICKSLVESMGGAIGFESQPGNTVFHFRLPISRSENTVSSSPSVGVKKILICEDDADIAFLLGTILEKEGFAHAIASTAAQARAMAATGEYQGMTLDLGLPDQDGMELIKELHSAEKTKNLPIIVISANAEKAKKAMKDKDSGVLGWLSKPIDVDILKKLLTHMPTDGRLPRILHVEDDYDFNHMLGYALQGMAEVVNAPSLKEADKLIKNNDFNLVVLDIDMPDGNGLSLLPQLTNKNIPTIILSVYETPRDLLDNVEASMIKSVVSEEKIVKTIRSFIKRR